MWQTKRYNRMFGHEWRDIYVADDYNNKTIYVRVPGIVDHSSDYAVPQELAEIIGPDATDYLTRAHRTVWCKESSSLRAYIENYYKKRAEVCMQVLPQPIAEEICEYL